MSETISGYHNTLQLLNPGTASATITGTIKADGTFTGSTLHGYAAIYGPISAGFTVTNFGLIDDTQETNVPFPTQSAGIILGAPGSINNAGTILSGGSEAGVGVYLFDGGSVTNSGTVIGGGQGIFIGSENSLVTPAFITNAGYVGATTKPFTLPGGPGTYTGTAIFVLDSGTIDNGLTGTIVAEYGCGIDLTALAEDYAAGTVSLVAGGVINAGKVTAAYGVYFDALGAFTNTGTLSATRYGVQITAGSVVNSGTLIGGNAGVIAYNFLSISNGGTIESSNTAAFTPQNTTHGTLTLAPAGIDLLGGGDLTNLDTGTIIALDIGIGASSSAGVAATIENHGLIEANSTGLATVSGIIFAAIGIDALDGATITNTGSIIGVGEGILLEATSSSTANIDNSGLIAGVSTTFEINGNLEASVGIFLVDGGAVTNQVDGTISGYACGILSFFNLGPSDESSRNSESATSIINSGVVEGSDSTINLNVGTVFTSSGGVALNGGGALTNEATGTISGHFGVYLNGGSANIVNTIDNLGTIDGVTSFGVFLGENASLTNSGTIKAASYGALLYPATQLTNNTGGTISGDIDGVLALNTLSHAATIENAGLIEGTSISLMTVGSRIIVATGIYAAEGASINNTGTIIGGGDGILLLAPGTSPEIVDNSGLIASSGTTFEANGTIGGAVGIFLLTGGTVTNQVDGTISGYAVGIESFVDLGPIGELSRNSEVATSIINDGVIKAANSPVDFNHNTVADASAGVGLFGGGALTNDATGTISGHFGVYLGGGAANIVNTIDNLGTISGISGGGVFLGENATLTNSGHITGASYGAFLYAANRLTNLAGGTIVGATSGILSLETLGLSSTIENAGDVIATGTTYVFNGQTDDATGANMVDPGTFDNAATGTVTGYLGAYAVSDTTFINAGTISGASGTDIYFAGSGDRLVDDPGAVFNGLVDDAAGNGALELGAGTQTGTLGFGTQFIGFSSIAVDSGASWDFAGATTISNTVGLTNDGTITETGTDALTVDANITGTGVIVLDPTTVTLNGSVSAGEQVSFANTGDVLDLGDASQFNGTITGFSAGDTIDLANLAPASITAATFVNGVLTLTSSGGMDKLTLANGGGNIFRLSADGAGGTDLTEQSSGYNFATPLGGAPTSGYQAPGFGVSDSGAAIGSDSAGTYIYSNGSLTTLSALSGGTVEGAEAISGSGDIAGYYTSGTIFGGFIDNDGTFTTFYNPPGFTGPGLYVDAVNNSGEAAGSYQAGTINDGYIFENGTFTTFIGPTGTGIGDDLAPNLNDLGQFIGEYSINRSTLGGYIYSDGSYTTFAGPSGASFFGFSGLNDSGEAIGDISNTQGFIYENGNYTILSGPPGATSVIPNAINNSGEIAGYYRSGGTNYFGFVYENGTYTTIEDPAAPNSYNYDITGINDSGEIVGQYTDSAGYAVFFVATPGDETTVEPGTQQEITAGATANNPTLAGGILELDSGATVTGDISFSGSGSDLIIEPNSDGSTTAPANGISGFDPGDTIELAGVSFTGTGGTYGTAGEDTYTVATAGTLTIDADGTFYNLLIAGATVGQDDFVLSGDLEITEAACYAAGTRIATAVGEVKVEDLEIGDFVETLDGSLEKIKWIGRRSYVGRFIAGNKDVLPICIAKGAIADEIPSRDLYVSPGHAICIDSALIHAFRLVNGVSITQAEAVESVTYYHIETGRHKIIFAENCPAETFLDETFRAQFQNAEQYRALYPGETAACTSCLPLLEDGFALHAIQQRLNARAGILPPPGTHGALRGYVDQPGPTICAGWAQDIENPETPVCLDILVDGALVTRVLANLYRADLRQAALGSGCHAFRATLPPALTGPLEIRRAEDGAELPWTEAAVAHAA
jgi:hypothetical protein